MTDSPQNTPPSPASKQEIKSWLITKLAEQIGVAPNAIDIQEEFMNYGLNSIEAVNFSGEIEIFLGYKLSPTLLWDYSNITSLAEHLVMVATANNTKDDLANNLANIDRLSESEMDALLSSMLTPKNG